MQGIVFLIIIIAIVNSLTRAKKLKENRPGQTQKPGQVPPAKPASPAAPAKPVAQPAGQAKQVLLQELLQGMLGSDEEKKPAPAPKKSDFEEAFSFEDDKGCVGGSLPHDEAALHEGESSMAPEPRPIRTVRQPQAAAEPAVQRTALRVGAEDMRRAVVMAEILGRPKALRRSAR